MSKVQPFCKKQLPKKFLSPISGEFFMKKDVQNKDEEERPEWAWLMKRMTKET